MPSIDSAFALPPLAAGSAVVEPFAHVDLAAIYTIEQRSNPYPWSYTHFETSLACGHHCFGVRLGETWVGHAIVSRLPGEAELLLLVIDSQWQRQGIAHALLSSICDRLKPDTDRFFLEVRESNAAAIALYERLGFERVGCRRGYYTRGERPEDAWVYVRELSNDQNTT